MTPTLIIDCSITMAWCFADEVTAASAEIQDRLIEESAIVPSHWPLEIVNVLAMAEKRNRLSATDASQFLALLATLDIHEDDKTSARAFDGLLALCRDHGLTSYDATYLELAVRLQLPLATLDNDLRQAARKCGTEVLGK